MLKYETHIAKSNIHGLGLFTNVDIKKGSVVWEFNEVFDKKISDHDKIRLPEHIQKFIERHGFKDVTGWWILDGGNDLYVNHHNDPNLIQSDEPNPISKSLIASRDIKTGDELTENYLEWDDMVKLKNI
jgi:hypothetical protein